MVRILSCIVVLLVYSTLISRLMTALVEQGLFLRKSLLFVLITGILLISGTLLIIELFKRL
ncbi:hypothetical protein GCM10010954_29590 [Halobacillus andaensis]|uniref:Uncharacterized protein n=1 Tax=Halobacillus andaensis TaxID=1176239 RepID=A0A917B8G9_HALAA|nr:hypothetical protein [Halobacillus andaensis]MBP2005064.1 hypothetical protein [Halobacillus andaensis]GGF28598.1 hypothetical protein GCM10010954_29590 [Halobacillus andaensis]